MIETIAVVYQLTKRTQEKLFADWAKKYKAFFVPNQEPASARIFGNSSVRVGTQGLFRPYLKTFVPPFLPIRPTAPGSPRMESIFFSPTTEDEIITIAQSFASGKVAGYDNIPMSIIKESIRIISGPLAHIMKLSIAHGVVPDQMKIARVVPVFKADDQSLFTNYRPVSVLRRFSKFLERIIYKRLYDYLTNLHILCDDQFGFVKNHSTTLALIDLHEKISSAIDRGELAVGVFLDLLAFHTVNHSILFDKLEHYGIRGLALQWIKSYFSNRLQFVEYNGYVSSRANIMCGIPQGSILGPLFFFCSTSTI